MPIVDTSKVISLFSQDIVEIVDDNGNNIFDGATIMRISINDSADFMRQPRENGASQVDHKIDLPIEAKVTLIIGGELKSPLPSSIEDFQNIELFGSSLSYTDVYSKIQKAKIEATRLRLQTKAATYENLYIESIPHEEDPRKFSVITMILGLKQALIFSATAQELTEEKTIDPKDADIVNRGQIEPKSSGTVFQRFVGWLGVPWVGGI